MGIIYDHIINTILKYGYSMLSKKLYLIYSCTIKTPDVNTKSKNMKYLCTGLYIISFKELFKLYNLSNTESIYFTKANKATSHHFILNGIDVELDKLPQDDEHLLFKFIDTKLNSNRTKRRFKPMIVRRNKNRCNVYLITNIEYRRSFDDLYKPFGAFDYSKYLRSFNSFEIKHEIITLNNYIKFIDNND